MTPSKIKEAAAVRRRQTAILNAVDSAGSMTMAEILAHFSGTKRNISQGAVGFMIRCGMLESNPTAARTKNGNTINAYSVGGKGSAPKTEPETEPFLLGDVWKSHPRIQPIQGVTRSNRLSR